MQASTSKIVCSAVYTFQPAIRTSVRCASRTRRPGTSTSASKAARSRKAAAAPPPNAMPFSEAIRTLQSMTVGKEWAAYELTLLSRLAASVNINSLRGRTFLPHEAGSTSKKEVVLVFAEGEQAEEARRNGADIVGGSELIDEILQSRVSPTKIICAPDQLSTLIRSQLPRILGPKGLMPSAKRGTVTAEIGKAIKDARGGLDWLGVPIGSPTKANKNDPDRAMVSVPIARIAFDPAKIEDNIRQFGREVLDVCNGVGTQAEIGGADSSAKKKKAAIEKMFLKTTMSMSIEVTDSDALIAAP